MIYKSDQERAWLMKNPLDPRSYAEMRAIENDAADRLAHEKFFPPRAPVCPECCGSGAEFPGHPRTEKCERCNGSGHLTTPESAK